MMRRYASNDASFFNLCLSAFRQKFDAVVPVNPLDRRHGVAEQPGHLVDALTGHEHVRGAAVPEDVRPRLAAEPASLTERPERPV